MKMQRPGSLSLAATCSSSRGCRIDPADGLIGSHNLAIFVMIDWAGIEKGNGAHVGIINDSELEPSAAHVAVDGSTSTAKARSTIAEQDEAPGLGREVANFFRSLTDPSILMPNLTAATLLAVMNITTAISVAALVFSGPLAPSLGSGIGLFLIGTAVGGLVIAAGSGYKAVLAGPRSGQAPIVAGLVAGIAVTMEGAPYEEIAATAIAAILAATLFIGLVLYVIGRAKLGGLVRYIPFPVMGGFFAGLGFLLFQGGIFVSLGPLVDSNDLSSFLSIDVLLHLLPALAFAVLYYIADNKIRHWLLMPGFLVVTIVLFYGFVFATGSSVEQAGIQGWHSGLAFRAGIQGWHSGLAAQSENRRCVLLPSLYSGTTGPGRLDGHCAADQHNSGNDADEHHHGTAGHFRYRNCARPRHGPKSRIEGCRMGQFDQWIMYWSALPAGIC
jgi:hypothetical protein